MITLIGGENRNSKVNDTITTKTKFHFGSLPFQKTKTKQYTTKVDLRLIRSSNVDSYEIYINGNWVTDSYEDLPAMVSPGDSVRVEIEKKVSNEPAWILFQETIVR